MKQIDNRQKEVQQLKAAKGHLLSFRDKLHVKTKTEHEPHAPSAGKKANSSHAGEVTQPVHHEKIGRNDPCPCGSGKKYKKCCLNK